MRGLSTQPVEKTHKRAVSTAFGALAPFYDDWYSTPIGSYIWTVETAATLDLLPQHKPGIALEIGVGTGMTLDILRRASRTIVGIDISWQMLHHAVAKTKTNPEIHLILADGEHLPLRKHIISLTMGLAVIEFLPKPLEMLFEVQRVLDAEGKLLLGVLTSTNLWAVERRIRNLISPDVFQFATFPSPWQMKRMLHQSGFSVCATRGSVYAPSFSPKRWINQLAQIDQVLGKRWLSRPWGAYYCILACLPEIN